MIKLPPLEHLSYSHLHTAVCPYASFLRYDAGIRGPSTPWLALGSAVHLGLELGHQEEKFFVHEAVRVFKKEFNRIVIDEDVFIGYPQLKKLETDGIEMILGYDNQIQAGIISEQPLALEKEFSLKVSGTSIMGRIDKIDWEGTRNKFIVTDFKTGKTKPDPWFLRHNLQFTTYYLACKEINGEYPEKLVWHHLRTGEMFETVRTTEDVAQLERLIENVVKMREQGMRHRVFHEQVCGYCDFQGPVCDDLALEDQVLQKLGVKE